MTVSAVILRSFLTLAEELHFGRAAARLSIGTPTLSKQIAKLESQVGSSLFYRAGRTIELTPEGMDFLPVARQAVQALNGLDSWLTRTDKPDRPPVLTVGLSAGALGGHTAAVIERFRTTVPGCDLHFHRVDFTRPFAALTDGTVDVLLTSGHPDGVPPGIDVKLSVSDPRVLIVGRQHRLALRSWVTLDETTAETYLRVGPPDLDAVVRQLMFDPRPDGRALTFGQHAQDFETLLDLCAAGLGVFLATEAARFRYARPDISFVPVRDAPAGALVAAMTSTNQDPLALEFIAVAGEICRRPRVPRPRSPLTQPVVVPISERR